MKRIFWNCICILIAALSMAAPALAIGESAFRAPNPPKGAVWVDDLIAGGENPGLSVNKSASGGPIMLNGVIYQHGIGAFPSGVLVVNLNGAAERFASLAGVNDFSGSEGPVVFEVWADGVKAAESAPVSKGGAPQIIDADVAGAKQMLLVVRGIGSGNVAADWAGALLKVKPDAQSIISIATFQETHSMEIAETDFNEIGIHGPRVVGSTPGKPFLFRIPATGKAPLSFKVDNLPDGLVLDAKTGVISGSLKSDGETLAALKVTDASGAVAERKLKIVGGLHKLALTPPMGWNSWNVWGTSVDADKVRAAADAMEKSGLAAVGFQYVNIDDAWEGARDASGVLQTNEKFPDMKGLADYVHAKGLKLGIYSSPGPETCARYPGSYEHEQIDADTWAAWGIDYLKHDWCLYRVIAKDNSLPELQKPYLVMRAALDKASRDIVYSLCQYGMGNVWEWGADVGGNLWRTTGDIVDTWASMSGIGFSQNGIEKHAGPGHWNDPDMLVIGKVGWGPTIHPTRLTQNEQMTHITLWSMLASPLLIGCDMSDMDPFTKDLITNPEVLEVNQDPLGKQARKVADAGILLEVWARPLYDGTVAVGLFNRFVEDADITFRVADIGLDPGATQSVRNLWLRKDMGFIEGSFTVPVPAHGAVLLKVGMPQPNEYD